LVTGHRALRRVNNLLKSRACRSCSSGDRGGRTAMLARYRQCPDLRLVAHDSVVEFV
jgi:hypothetical protein